MNSPPKHYSSCKFSVFSLYIFGFDDFSFWVQNVRKIGEKLRRKLNILEFHIHVGSIFMEI